MRRLCALSFFVLFFSSVIAHAQQRTATVVLMPTQDGNATGVAHASISDNGNRLVILIEVNGLDERGPHATHIHEGFCPPPVGPSPDAQGPIVVDLRDTVQQSVELSGRDTVTRRFAGQLPTRPGGLVSFEELLDPSRNFYINVHLLSTADGTGPGQLCGRLEF